MARWHFVDEMTASEREAHDRTLARIDAWWSEFATRIKDLAALFKRQRKWDLPEWMERHLQAVDPQLMWEYGPAVRGQGHRLVITPESAKHLRPLVTTMLERAPTISGWEFYAYRLAEDIRKAEVTVKARAQGQLAGVEARVVRGHHNLIDLHFLSPRARQRNDSQALNEAFVATETLLGEKLMDRWIGVIDVEPLAAQGPVVSLAELRPAVERLVGEIQEGLPSEPHQIWTASALWHLLKMDPERADDYPEQHDLFVAKTPHLPLWQAAHLRSFYDERFSRCGEIFAYLKLDGSQGLDEEKFADKSEIEDALDAVLMPANLGCQIGGGTGLRYSYIDLALTDLDKAVDAIRARLREGNVPRRSWIQFFNAEWRQEWIGVYPDSPPPPLPPAGD
jgi:hypothetical protein